MQKNLKAILAAMALIATVSLFVYLRFAEPNVIVVVGFTLLVIIGVAPCMKMETTKTTVDVPIYVPIGGPLP